MNFSRDKKEHTESHSRSSTFKRKHTIVGSIFIGIFILATMVTPGFASSNGINWTEDELAFMEEHPVIRVAVDPEFVPFEFLDEKGEYKGIAADYLSLIGEKTGLQFEFEKDVAWPKAYDMVAAGDLDLLPAITKTDERQEQFLFSEPYYDLKNVIVTRDTDTDILGMDDLEGMTVSVQRNTVYHNYLLSFSEMNISTYDSVEDSLMSVATGTSNAYLGTLATSNYFIRSNGITNLRVVSFEIEEQQNLHFAVRKDWPELVSIFNKSINNISNNEKLAINSSWVDLDTDFDYGPILRTLIIIGAVIAIVLGVSFFWIAKLRKEIRRRKQIQLDLEKAKLEVDKTNSALMLAEKALEEELKNQTLSYETLFEHSPIGIVIMRSSDSKDSDEKTIRINSIYEKITGRTREELESTKWAKFTHPDDLKEDIDNFRKLQAGEIKNYSMRKRLIRPDKSIVWVYMTVAALGRNEEDEFFYICLFQDITEQVESIEALLESEKKYRSITDNMSDIVWRTDLSLKTTYVSPSVKKLLGETPEEHMGKKMEEKFPEQSLRKIQAFLVEEKENEKNPRIDKNRARNLEVEHYKADGTVVWIEMTISFLRDDNGNAVGFQGASRDITQRKLAETALLESERSKSVLLFNLPGMAYRCNYDRKWTMQFVSAGSLGLTGYAPESLINNKDIAFNDVIAPAYREAIRNEWTRGIAERSSIKYEFEIITASGERKWVIGRGQAIYDEKGDVEALEGIILDISERKKIEDRLKYNYEHDRDTGLYNITALRNQVIEDEKKKLNTTRAIILINLSTLQRINMVYGFTYTRELIKNIAEILKQYSTENRTLYKTYENRFAYYIKGYSDKNELLEFSQEIKDALWEILRGERIGAGIGILEFGDADEFDLSIISKGALIASFKAISLDENDIGICFYDSEMEAQLQREEDIKMELANIVENNEGGELYLQFQPILDLKTDRISSFEALARLKTHKLGLIPPLEFIPIAEASKLIIPIGWKIFREAFAFQKKLEGLGYENIGVGVNVSAVQLMKEDFTKHLFDLMDEMQVAPSNIDIEITESIFASNLNEINKILAELRNRELKISIDDFGTGYSSLARERELNVDCLKIDKYFIDKLMEISYDKAITGDIINIAHKQGHSALAEGVEYEEQRQYLLNNGCDKMQGYLFSKPLDEKAAIEFLMQENKK